MRPGTADHPGGQVTTVWRPVRVRRGLLCVVTGPETPGRARRARYTPRSPAPPPRIAADSMRRLAAPSRSPPSARSHRNQPALLVADSLPAPVRARRAPGALGVEVVASALGEPHELLPALEDVQVPSIAPSRELRGWVENAARLEHVADVQGATRMQTSGPWTAGRLTTSREPGIRGGAPSTALLPGGSAGRTTRTRRSPPRREPPAGRGARARVR
jgi:hypothetical protein